MPTIDDPLHPARLDESAAGGGLYFGLFTPYEHRWAGPDDGPLPERPDGLPMLRDIVPERWAEVLKPLLRTQRAAMISGVPMHPAELGAIIEMLRALPPPSDEIAQQSIASSPRRLPLGAMARQKTRYTRQLSIRVDRDDHALLESAAHIAGTTPTTLARMLILGGMRKILADHGEHYAG